MKATIKIKATKETRKSVKATVKAKPEVKAEAKFSPDCSEEALHGYGKRWQGGEDLTATGMCRESGLAPQSLASKLKKLGYTKGK